MKHTRTAIAGVALAALLAGCADNDDSNDSKTPAAPAATAASVAPSTPASPTPAGNGVADLQPDAIVAKAKAAALAAKSFHVKGNVADGGDKVGLDLEVDGKDVVGSITLGKARAELLKVGKLQYIRGDKAFWTSATGSAKQADTVVTVMNGRWAKIPANNKDFGDLFSITDVSSILDPDGKVTKGAAKEINGVPAIGLKDTGSDPGTLWVATQGEPYPLRLDGPKPSDGSLSFSEFGEKFADLKAPAAKDVIDLAKLNS